MSVKDDLLACFNSIPTDGSNIKDDDDDNGYENTEGTIGVKFEEKVSDLNDRMKVAPPQVELEVPKKVEAVVEQKTANVPVVPPHATSTPEATEALLKQAIAATPVHVSEPAGITNFDEVDLPDMVEQKGLPETTTEVKSEAKEVDKEDTEQFTEVPEKEEPVSQPAVQATVSAHKKNFDAEAWHLTSPSQKFDDMYEAKAHVLSYILPGGKLPFEQYHEELLRANVDPNVATYNLNTLYERMQEVQQWRHRVLEIKLHGEHQYYFWKRHMEMFRSWAARVEGLKGAAVDSTAFSHLWDFEKYWQQVEALVKKSEGVMKNLEGLFECLSRQVTIALPQREIERFEHKEPKQRENQFTQIPEAQLQQFDSLEAHAKPARKPAQSEGGWEIVR